MSTDDRSDEQYPRMAKRWETPPNFTPIPEWATPEQRLHIRFGQKRPPVGTVERIEWDRLDMDHYHQTEWIVPAETCFPEPDDDGQKGGAE